VERLLDSQQVETARLLAVSTLHESEEYDLEGYASDMLRGGYQYPMVFQVWSTDGRLLIRGPQSPYDYLSPNRRQGFTNEHFSNKSWRVYTLRLGAPGHLIQVAGEDVARRALTLNFLLNALAPFLIIFPLFGFLWLGVRRGSAPLRWIAAELSSRDGKSLQPVSGDRVPSEIVPLVDEINSLFRRLQESLDRYSHFAADAAHELRTPLAGTIAQIHAAGNSDDPEARGHALAQAEKGLRRLSRVVEQLLLLAGVETAADNGFAVLELNKSVESVLVDFYPEAEEKGVELQLHADEPITIDGNDELIRVMLRNLLENALRASPAGGAIIIRLGRKNGFPFILIEDMGQGIPMDKAQRLFERFYRLPRTPGDGAGIGLSIVYAVADIHHARLSLENCDAHHGLCVAIVFSGTKNA
jgi:signal transduction histidine kinase